MILCPKISKIVKFELFNKTHIDDCVEDIKFIILGVMNDPHTQVNSSSLILDLEPDFNLISIGVRISQLLGVHLRNLANE